MTCTSKTVQAGSIRYHYEGLEGSVTITLYWHKGMFAEGVQVFRNNYGKSYTVLSSYRPSDGVGAYNYLLEAKHRRIFP